MPLEPNATCPICGAPVYFWMNAAGSKVWFDALGSPWPKHPCLDLKQATSAEHHAFIQRTRSNTNPALPAPKRVSRGLSLGILVAILFLTCCPGSLLIGVVAELTGDDSVATDVTGYVVVGLAFTAFAVFAVRGLIRVSSANTEANDALTLARNHRRRG